MKKILYDNQIFDSKANRHIDANGRLVIERSLITRECVNNYLGSELLKSLDPAEAAALGIEADKTYAVFRPGEEMQKALPEFNRIPLLKEHVMDYPDMPQQENRTGSISDSKFEDGKVFASITVWDKDSIREIQNESKRDLSLGYKSKFAKESGTFNGAHYDLKMYDIVPNHLALVEKGRVPGAEVFDGKSKKGVSMANKNKLLAAIKKAIFDAMPEEEKEEKLEVKEVKDSGFKEKIIAVLNEKLGDKAAEIITLLEPVFAEEVTDESLAEEHKAGAAAAKEGLEKFLTAEEKESKELKDAKEEDFENKQKEAKEIMDSAINLARAEMIERETAKEEVRAVTGSLGILDSASAYYKAGCEALGLETKGVMDSAYKPMFKAAKAMRDKTATPAAVVMDKDAGKTAEARINNILGNLPERKFI